MIRYSIQPARPEAHLFNVELWISTPDPDGQIVSMPAWIPGSYMIRDFARNIITLKATCNGSDLPVRKIDKQTWQCDPCDSRLCIEYQVYAWDLSVRGAYLDITRAFFTGASVFLRVMGQDRKSCQVDIIPPQGERYRNWKVATTLSGSGTGFLSFGDYRAADYEELIDHPVEMADFSHVSFQVAGVSHDVVVSGRHNRDIERVCEDLQAICDQHVRLFGELPEMARYLFQVMVVGDGYGGLEHRSSTSLLCKRDDLPRPADELVSDGYRQFLGLCSHEYFHLWNVKRIRPQVFKEAGLSREVYTSLLWAFEGITSYYDDLALVRSGRIGGESYLELLARQITRFSRGAGRLRQTLAESSFDAWTKFYKQDENAPNAIVSYYTKGAVVALALDITIRRETRGKKSLDDVMRGLWNDYGKPDVGVREDDVERLAMEVSGLDLREFFDRYLRGTDELPLVDLLSFVGVGMQLRPAEDSSDLGGLRKEDSEAKGHGSTLGVKHRLEGQDIRLVYVYEGGAAQKAGLSAGDTIVAVGGIRSSGADLDKQIAQIPAGEVVPVHVFRRDELMEFDVRLAAAPADTCALWMIDRPGEEVLEHRLSWLAPNVAD